MDVRQMGDFRAPEIGDRCPFCGKAWSDEGPCGDPEPDRRSWWSKRRQAVYEIECQRAGCGRKFVSTRSNARYCSESCKVAAHRLRKSGGN